MSWNALFLSVHLKSFMIFTEKRVYQQIDIDKEVDIFKVKRQMYNITLILVIKQVTSKAFLTFGNDYFLIFIVPLRQGL